MASAQRYWFVHSHIESDVDGTKGRQRRCWSHIPSALASAERAAVQARYPNATPIAVTHGCWEVIPAAPGAPARLRYLTVSDPRRYRGPQSGPIAHDPHAARKHGQLCEARTAVNRSRFTDTPQSGVWGAAVGGPMNRSHRRFSLWLPSLRWGWKWAARAEDDAPPSGDVVAERAIRAITRDHFLKFRVHLAGRLHGGLGHSSTSVGIGASARPTGRR